MKDNEKFFKGSLALIMLAIIFWGITFPHYYYWKVSASKNQTVGIVTKLYSYDTGCDVYYEYHIDNARYTQHMPIPEGRGRHLYYPKVGEKYNIKYLVNYPSWSIILLDSPVR